MFKVLFSYSGWQNVNYVLNEVKNPVRTLKIAGPLGLGITSALYILANISYFAYVKLTHYPGLLPNRAQLQRIFKEGHCQIWHNCRLVLQERFWRPRTESPDCFRGTKVFFLGISLCFRF